MTEKEVGGLARRLMPSPGEGRVSGRPSGVGMVVEVERASESVLTLR
jgi:hypothetical protein